MGNKSLTAAQLALYLGCKVIVADIEYELAEVSVTGTCCVYRKEDGLEHFDASVIKPILRKLSSLTEAESERINMLIDEYIDGESPGIRYWQDGFFESHDISGTWCGVPAVWQHLLSIGVDLFGWIDAGLAVDAQTLNNAGN